MTDDWQEVEKAGRRVNRYWYVDGLAEIAIGVLLLLVGLFFWIEETAPHTLLARATEFTVPVLVIVGGLLLRRLVDTAKEHVTYRRTGYVSYRRAPRWRLWLAAGLAGILAAAVTIVLRITPGAVRWLPVFQGVVVAAGLALLARRIGVERFYLYASVSALSGVGVSLMAWSSERAAAACFGTIGLAMVVGGLVTLARYLSRTGAPEAD